jgi:hypothetical protein
MRKLDVIGRVMYVAADREINIVVPMRKLKGGTIECLKVCTIRNIAKRYAVPCDGGILICQYDDLSDFIGKLTVNVNPF